MTFSKQRSEGFGKWLAKSPYTSPDPLVKVQYEPRGKNLIFGRTLDGDDYNNLIYLGKVLEKSQTRSYFGADAWLDVSFPHVIYITGTRGSGKSFDLGVILEGISSLSIPSPIQNGITPITSIVIDTQSQFWTLGYKPILSIPENERQLNDLNEWRIAPNSLRDLRVFVPSKSPRNLGTEIVFRIRPRDVTHEDWCALLSQDVYGPQGHILGETIRNLENCDYTIRDMMNFINDGGNFENVPDISRNAIMYRLAEYDRSDLFSPYGLNPTDLLDPGQCSVFMLRDLHNADISLITAIIARRLFVAMGNFHSNRKVAGFFGREKINEGKNLPGRVWLIIDEAHVVAPADDSSPARDALVEYVKRGRDAGLSLVMATQQPSAVDDRILSQVNISFNHRLTFQRDILAAVNRIPTKTLNSLRISGVDLTDFGDMLRLLNAGEAFVGDHTSSRAVLTLIRPRVTSHGGYSPA